MISWYYKYYHTLRESHRTIHNRLLVHLVVSWITLMATLFMFTIWKENRMDDGFWIVFLPLEIFIISALSMFLYMLPGLLDPENLIERRYLFYFAMYMIAFLIISVTVSFINDTKTIQNNSTLIWIPLICSLCIHFLSLCKVMFSFPKETAFEAFVICSIFAVIILSKFDITSLTLFIMMAVVWVVAYIYYCLPWLFTDKKTNINYAEDKAI
mmetsp:Transcript_38116/g.27699  ORF Transcript_38116/g.27699 Transcript_38116/m.27699 type:complete len:212 (+) Transcript_38116:639-1274(+)